MLRNRAIISAGACLVAAAAGLTLKPLEEKWFSGSSDGPGHQIVDVRQMRFEARCQCVLDKWATSEPTLLRSLPSTKLPPNDALSLIVEKKLEDRARLIREVMHSRKSVGEEEREAVFRALGFVPEMRSSTLSGAGNGLYVRGTAEPGELVAIYGGTFFNAIEQELVDTDVLSVGAANLPNSHTFAVFDWTIDGLEPDFHYWNNPFALAQMANHPREGAPNCFFFPVKMDKFPAELRPYIPNRSVEKPIEEIEVCVVLLALRKIKNEEVFTDYEFVWPYPRWYHPVSNENLIPAEIHLDK